MSLWSQCTTDREGDSGYILCTHPGSCPQHRHALRGCRRIAGQDRLLRAISQLCGALVGAGHRGVNCWDTEMRHCPLCPAPSRIYLHRGAVLPVRSDLIASPLLKPKHICLVIIKSWGGTPRSEAQTCCYCEHQRLCRWCDRGCSCLGTARLSLARVPQREGDGARTPKQQPPRGPARSSLLTPSLGI